jgi:hypothetical protein
METEKSRRLANAIGFLSGVLASMDALRDTKIYWPPGLLWEELHHAQRLELGGGLALIVVTLVTSALQRRSA